MTFLEPSLESQKIHSHRSNLCTTKKKWSHPKYDCCPLSKWECDIPQHIKTRIALRKKTKCIMLAILEYMHLTRCILPQGKAPNKLTLVDHYIQTGIQTQEIQWFVPNLYCISNFHPYIISLTWFLVLQPKLHASN